MILNAEQISSILGSLKAAYAEQEWILEDSERVICRELAGAWECQAQKAYVDVFVDIKDSTLAEISTLILAFETALEHSQNGLYQVNVDISSMNSTTSTG